MAEVEVTLAPESTAAGSARVTVLDHEGLPSDGAWVLLDSVVGGITNRWSDYKRCDKTGWAEFSKVPVGEYLVRPFPPGKRPVVSRWRPLIVPPDADLLTIEAKQTVAWEVELGEP